MSDSTKMILIATLIFLAACCVAGGILLVVFWPGSQIARPALTATPLPTSGYQVFFTSPKYPDKEGDHHGSLDENLTTFINTARSTVDLAIYQLDLPNVTQALLDAKKRGAIIRIVTDVDILNDATENASFKQLQSTGISVVAGNPNAIMHDKFVVVDHAAVWTGSWNFTVSDTYRYNNNGIVIYSQPLANNYSVTFEKMFNDKKFGPSRKPGGTIPRLMIGGLPVENYFSPEDNVTSRIAARVSDAKQTVDFMAYSFTDDTVGNILRDRSKAGVRIRGIFEKSGSETQFSEYGKMRKNGLDVWQDGNPYLMHHKVFILDNKTVILGSFNFSQNAETDNDENILIVDDPDIAQAYAGEFARVYEQAKSPPKK